MMATWLLPDRPRPIDIDPKISAWEPVPAEVPKNADEEVAGNAGHRDSLDKAAVVACVGDDRGGALDRE